VRFDYLLSVWRGEQRSGYRIPFLYNLGLGPAGRMATPHAQFKDLIGKDSQPHQYAHGRFQYKNDKTILLLGKRQRRSTRRTLHLGGLGGIRLRASIESPIHGREKQCPGPSTTITTNDTVLLSDRQ